MSSWCVHTISSVFNFSGSAEYAKLRCKHSVTSRRLRSHLEDYQIPKDVRFAVKAPETDPDVCRVLEIYEMIPDFCPRCSGCCLAQEVQE